MTYAEQDIRILERLRMALLMGAEVSIKRDLDDEGRGYYVVDIKSPRAKVCCEELTIEEAVIDALDKWALAQRGEL